MESKKVILECIICGKNFYPTNKQQRYCSPECRRRTSAFYLNRKKIKKYCPICRNDFLTYRKDQKYCSAECRIKRNTARLIQWKKEENYQPPYLKMRFQVFERDNFKCRYCGRGVLDGVKLEVDHILPKKLNGSDKLNNYITACAECNVGKGDILLLANRNGQLPTFISV